MYHFTDGGLRNVWLVNGYKTSETPYGSAVSIQDVKGLTRAICKVLVRKKSHLTGAEFRYLRLALLMSQSGLGRTLGRTEQAIASWEKTGHIPKFADTMMRFIYARHENGDEQVKNIVEAVNETDRDIHIVMRDSKAGWSGSESTKRPEAQSSCDSEDLVPV
ncbi:MAG TPA: hypothetical protein VFR20_06260 [Burkholderiaceae bacterium]|nr:hypothetical protein [Burkholderiaceae bacterium]